MTNQLIKTNQETVPSHFVDIGDVMSNFDHEIEDGAEKKLKSGEFYGSYPAQNFYGCVWFDGEVFLCQVNCYQSHEETVTAPTLRGIMDAVSDDWGWA